MLLATWLGRGVCTGGDGTASEFAWKAAAAPACTASPVVEACRAKASAHQYSTPATAHTSAHASPRRFGVDATDGSSISYEEVGVNDFGVAISSTETIESSEAALAFDPLNNGTGVSVR